MNAAELWTEFTEKNGIDFGIHYDEWSYGSDDPDALLDLTLKGIKTATASAYQAYEYDNSPIPSVGLYSVLLNSKGEAVCIIRNIAVTVVPFLDVSAEHAFKEGEGDRSLAFWREVHTHFFTKELEAIGEKFNDSIPVVCEEFSVVYSVS